MKIRLAIWCCLLVCVSSCSQSLERRLELDLEQAYADSTDASYKRFFAEWNHAVKPSSADTRDTVARAIYEIFTELYSPFDLLRLGAWEWRNDLNSSSRYAVIQDQIEYNLIDSAHIPKVSVEWGTENSSFRTIEPFYPILRVPADRVLYLTRDYSKAMFHYLGTDEAPLGTGNIMNPSQAVGESERRHERIAKYITALHGHNGGWWLITHPNVTHITLNGPLTEAVADFRVGYQGGTAFLRKIGGKWSLIESRATWIE